MLGSHILSTASRAAAALAAAGMLAAAPASATLIGNLTFTTPTATVGATEIIEIYITLTLDETSDALITDAFGNITSGLNDQDFEDAGFDPAEVAGSYLNVFFECSGTFTTICNEGPPYDFDFAFNTRDINIEAGGSATFLFGTFAPTGGVAPPGTYSFFNAGITANPLDEDGNFFPDPTYGYPRSFTLFQTCPGQNPDCAFTRTVEGVSAVPEPANWAMMIAGFGAVGGAMRRRAGYRLVAAA